eukprot:COSAG06_NODE_240_length_19339_cov_16.770582_2_plen_165_part_00
MSLPPPPTPLAMFVSSVSESSPASGAAAPVDDADEELAAGAPCQVAAAVGSATGFAVFVLVLRTVAVAVGIVLLAKVAVAVGIAAAAPPGGMAMVTVATGITGAPPALPSAPTTRPRLSTWSTRPLSIASTISRCSWQRAHWWPQQWMQMSEHWSPSMPTFRRT